MPAVQLNENDEIELFTEKLKQFWIGNADTILKLKQAKTYGIISDFLGDGPGIPGTMAGPPPPPPRVMDDPYVPQQFTHFPSKELTGIDISLFRLASTVSASMYQFSSDSPKFRSEAFNFDGYPADLPQPEVIFSTDDGIFMATNVPFAMVVVDHTLILAWRGSVTIMDWDRDVSLYLGTSARWSKLASVVNVHGGILSQAETTLVTYEEYILEQIERRNITQILTTGHSLGGGVAQLANMWLVGSMSDHSINGGLTHPKWAELKSRSGGLTVRTVSFEGPSTNIFKKGKDPVMNQKGLDFLELCGSTMINTCFQNDVVPRLPSNPLPVLNYMIDLFERYIFGSSYEYILVHVIISFLEKYALAATIDSIRQLYNISTMYNFIGRIIYYSDRDAMPAVYVDDRDGGYVYPTPTNRSYPQFNSIHFERTSTNPTQAMDLVYDHDFPIEGPGFSLNFQPYYCTKFGYTNGQCTNPGPLPPPGPRPPNKDYYYYPKKSTKKSKK